MASSDRQQPTDRKDPSPLGLTPTQPSLTEEVKKSAVANDNLEELEAEITCPIKGAVFFDPVIVTCCGKTYEEEGIHEWLAVKQNCPDCRAPLDKSKLLKNRALKNTCDKLTKLHPALAATQYFSITLLEKYLFDKNDSEDLNRIVRGLVANPESLNHINAEGISAVIVFCVTELGRLALLKNKLLCDAISEETFNFPITRPNLKNFTPIAFLLKEPIGRKVLAQNQKLLEKILPASIMRTVKNADGTDHPPLITPLLYSEETRGLFQDKDFCRIITLEMLTFFENERCNLSYLIANHADQLIDSPLLDKITPEALLIPYPSGLYKGCCCLLLLVIDNNPTSLKVLAQSSVLRSKITAKSLFTYCDREEPFTGYIIDFFVRTAKHREILNLILKENPQVRKDLLNRLTPEERQKVESRGISLQDPEAKQLPDSKQSTSISQLSLLSASANPRINGTKENPMRPSKK